MNEKLMSARAQMAPVLKKHLVGKDPAYKRAITRCYPDPLSDGQFSRVLHVHFFRTHGRGAIAKICQMLLIVFERARRVCHKPQGYSHREWHARPPSLRLLHTGHDRTWQGPWALRQSPRLWPSMRRSNRARVRRQAPSAHRRSSSGAQPPTRPVSPRLRAPLLKWWPARDARACPRAPLRPSAHPHACVLTRL